MLKNKRRHIIEKKKKKETETHKKPTSVKERH